ncbi:unnamed protein product [Effrenium voratum]|uniref:HECT domain-containing protein n=1 Tax=Effrenium voratum TaxID=2562239 RepID=A0AA36MLV2_9DINO|nr:unnamed protein product [Effrenium voratum]
MAVPSTASSPPHDSSQIRPILLNERLKVKSYDGGSQRGRAQYDVRHVLTPLADPFHSSNSGTKFNLVLESSEDFTVTHVFVSGPGSRCSEPIRSGLIFISDSLPSVEESRRYDGLGEEELQEAVKAFASGAGSADPNLPGPCAYFKTDATSREVEVELPKWVQGRYAMVKFLDTHGRQDHIEVAMLALVGLPGQRASEQVPLGPWMRRSVRQPKVHPNCLKSMFSSGGWVCDGRDVPGGCRSGMTDFHQSSVFTITFRCPSTGFDLCEACAFDANLGQVTQETVRADIEALRDPSKCRLACSRLRNLLRRNWLASLPALIDGGLFDVLAEALQSPSWPAKPDVEIGEDPAEPLAVGTRVEARYQLSSGRITSRYYAGRIVGRNEDGSYQVDYDDGDKWYNVPQDAVIRRSATAADAQQESKKGPQQALRSTVLELAQRLFSRCAGLAAGDQVLARRPGSDRWEEGKILALPSPFANVPEPGIGNGEAVAEGFGYYVCWRDGRQMVWVRPSDVFKAATGTRNAMTATIGLFTEVAQGEACDQSAIARHLQRGADLAAADGSGYPVLLLAVRAGAPVEVVEQLIDTGACVETSGPLGMTPLEQARADAQRGKETAVKLEALLSRTSPALSVSPQEQLRTLRTSFGRRILGPILTSYSASAIPVELLEVLQFLLQSLDFQVLVDCLTPSLLRALSRLLQHTIGGADGLKTALLGCRICRALVSHDEASLARFVHCHGVLRWANWLASRKPTGPPPPPRSGNSMSSLFSGHQQQQHQQLQQRAAGEELSSEASLLALELAEAEEWSPDASLAETIAAVGRADARGTPDSTLEALQRLRHYLEMDGDIPSGLLGLDLLRATNMCTAYAFEKLDLAGHLLSFLRCGEPEDRRSINVNSWECLTKALSSVPGGMKQLIRTLHAIIEIGEKFPVWHQKRERGLRALTDPVNLKVRHVHSSPKQFSVPVEPIAPISELRRYLLRVTPVVAEGFLSYCHSIVGANILERTNSSADWEKATVTAFEVLIGEIPLPIHTIQRPGKDAQKVLLAMREHQLLTAPNTANELCVHLARLQVAAGSTMYHAVVKAMRSSIQDFLSSDMEESLTLSPEVETLRDAAMVAAKSLPDACEILDAELARVAAAADAPKSGNATASDNTVHPHMRAHTVSLVASDEIPFDVFWPMVRDDILGAVREVCPRGHHSSESAIQAGVQQNGMGPLATRLTLEEAEMLAARVGHVVQSAVSVDQAAAQEIKADRDKKEGDHVAVGARVQFQPRGDNWVPGVVVGHGLVPPGAVPSAPSGGTRGQASTPGRPCDVIDDQGVLWERVPAARVHAQAPHHQERSQSLTLSRRDAPLELSPAGRLTAELSSRREGLFAELMRLRDRLRFRREEEDEPEVPEGQEQEDDEEEEDEDEEESEQPPGSMNGGGLASVMAAVAAAESSQASPRGAAAAAMAALTGAISSRPPSESGSASPPATFGFAGFSNAVAALSGPRPPSPPFELRQRHDEELRVLERFRSLEHILPEDMLSGPMSGIQLRRGNGDGVLEIRRIFDGEGGGRGGRSRNGAPKPPPLRAELPAFVRAADMTSPSVSLDHPVADRLGAADLEQAEAVEEDLQPSSPIPSTGSRKTSKTGASRLQPQLALRLCMMPASESSDAQAEVPAPSRELPETWNLMKAIHHLQDHPRQASPGFSQAIVENWSLGYKFVWTGANDFASIVREAQNTNMEVDEEMSPALSSSKNPPGEERPPMGSPPVTPARKKRRTGHPANMSRELYQAEVLANECLAADNPSVANAVELLRLLQANCHELAEDALLWTSAKLDKKLQVQLEDALSVVSATLPPWTTTLPRLCPFLLSLEARKKLLKYTAFGPSFAIHWVQEHKVGSLMQRRATVQTELNSQADPRKIQELSQELSNLEEHVVRSSNWLGTLQSTLVKVSKGDLLLRQSEVAMDLLSGSGHLLEVQFDGETGFGSAVTQSFYVEVSMALQDRELNRQIPLWVEDDGSSCTPYLLSRRGLLIRPVAEGPLREAACQRFRFLGRLMGHALRDGFIAPLPLTEDFFALVLGQRLGVKNLPEPGAGLAGELLGALAKFAEHLAVGRKHGKGDLWRQEQANLPDFTSRYLATDAGAAGIESKVEVTESSEQQLSLDDYLKLLGVSFLETGLSGASLCPGGENVPVTLDNLEEFLEQAATFWFDTGVRAQVDAFRAGLNEILPVWSLRV